MSQKTIVVCGAGGFIGGHLVKKLQGQEPDAKVIGVDIKPFKKWFQLGNNSRGCTDLRKKESCYEVLASADEVYNLACDMGGMGFITFNRARCSLSVLINTHLLMAAQDSGVKRYFYSSSACVYPAQKQETVEAVPLKESDAFPAMPEAGYGWEKLYSELMCKYFREDFGLTTRMARFHNCYGPYGAFEGGREKAPAAICRKIISAKLSGIHEIDIWGDGEQTRSFMYIDDCVEGIRRLMRSEIIEPLNVGSSELVTINQLVSMVEEISGIRIKRNYIPNAPLGVRGRNSDNALIKELLGWEPTIKLVDGLEKTYRWIYDQMAPREL